MKRRVFNMKLFLSKNVSNYPWVSCFNLKLLELNLLGKLFSTISLRVFSLCSILTTVHSCSDEMLDKLSNLEYSFSISLTISHFPNSASRNPVEIIFSILFEISSTSRSGSWIFSSIDTLATSTFKWLLARSLLSLHL